MSNSIYPDFEREASCASGVLHPDIWFDYEVTRGGSIQHTDSSKLAKKICYECPALRECRAYAMQYNNLWGIWGGLDHIERSRIQKANKLRTVDFILSYPSPTQPLREVGQGSTVKISYE
jgi:WhiB family redox-sensing transcriptional regulator